MNSHSSVAMTPTRLRWVTAIVLIWLSLLLVMMAWWGWIVRAQAQKIAELQTLAGSSTSETHQEWLRTQRMLFWEAGTYVVLLLGLSGFMAWLYWRDRRRSKSLQAFLASVTHELKTPLTSIRLQAEALAETPSGSSPATNELLGRLLEDTGRLEAQVEKTLELARMEGGGQPILQALPVVAWLDRFRSALYRPETLVIEAAALKNERHWIVLADPNALQVIFRNLLENTVRHSQAASPQARVSVEDSGGQVCLVVADEGRGFHGNAKKLGSLFFRGSRSQGAGVGLYLIDRLMQRMGGRACFTTAPDKGFVARLCFRRAEDAP